jgi:mono/diheme cytochrome c family protein
MHTITRTFALLVVAGTAIFAADAKAGKAPYDQACKSCHGLDGAPNPSIAKMMKVEMKDLKAAEVQALPNDAMEKIIKEGKGKMMAVKSVTGPAVDNVVAYVKTLKK